METSKNLERSVNQQLEDDNIADYSNECVKIKVEPKLENYDLNQPSSGDRDIKIGNDIPEDETSDLADIITMQEIKEEIKEEMQILDLPISHNDQKIWLYNLLLDIISTLHEVSK
uniref:Uncharacterized protein LOC114341101 n=1 Tax=Diabrotica virgifera virgifera TaxID=50390 RepID=A0A6P7GNU4_DIAVI